MRRVLFRAFNKNQLIILWELSNGHRRSISSLLRAISNEMNIPLSTLKLNAKILKELGLIDFGDGKTFKLATLTHPGKVIMKIIVGEDT